MTYEEIEKHKKHLCEDLSIMVEKVEKISKEKKEWSLSEMSMMTDMLKDLSCIYKNVAKAHYYFKEHSIERY